MVEKQQDAIKTKQQLLAKEVFSHQIKKNLEDKE